MTREEMRKACFEEINGWINYINQGINPNFNPQARASAHAVKWTMEALNLLKGNELQAITDMINMDIEIPLD